MKQEKQSYSQILWSSSIIGVTQAITYGLGLARVKALALLLGPAGVGLLGYFQSAQGLAGTLTSFGVTSSGVRQIAVAQASGDKQCLARTVLVLRRFCWISALLGFVSMCGLAFPLSRWSFGSAEQVLALALLGLSLSFSAISGGQTAYLQGLRRITDLARVNMLASLISTIAALGCFAIFGNIGIALSLVLSALITLAFSWVYTRRIDMPSLSLTWRDSLNDGRQLLGMGFAFMWCGLLASVVALVTRSMLVQELGIAAAGIYQAAWGISGLFAGFILGAMGTDYYPRLTAVANDHFSVSRLINQQTEIGLLLALPGLIGTLMFGRELMVLLYSTEFVAGADMLPWFVLGVLGRVVSWPMGYLVLAKGLAFWFILIESLSAVFGVIAMLVLLRSHGLAGVAVAFALLYLFHTVVLLLVGRHLVKFRWNKEVWQLLAFAGTLILLSFWGRAYLMSWARTLFGVLITGTAALMCLRGIVLRLGPEWRKAPWAKRVSILRNPGLPPETNSKNHFSM